MNNFINCIQHGRRGSFHNVCQHMMKRSSTILSPHYIVFLGRAVFLPKCVWHTARKASSENAGSHGLLLSPLVPNLLCNGPSF